MADKKIIKDDEFFYSLVVYQVENHLFKVPREPFIRESDVFRDMFDLPEPEDTANDGTDESHPLRLDGVQAEEFRAFLRVLLGPHRNPFHLSQDEWVSVLKLSHMWTFNEVRRQAIKELEASATNPIQQIRVARQFDIPDWMPKAYSELVDRKDRLTKQEVEQLGWHDAFEVTHFREQRLEKLINHFTSGHKRKRTCQEGHPPIEIPASTSCRKTSCRKSTLVECVDDGCEKFDIPGAPKILRKE